MNKQQKARITDTVNGYNKGKKYPLDERLFIDHCKRYIKAIREGRMICSIDSVSASGMSRTLKFIECARSQKVKPTQYYILNFYQLFDALGFQKVKDSDYFRVHGCGMDMVFATNYQNIHQMAYMGIISKKEADILAQRTPQVI
jgi:hypothetical protein